MKLCGLIANRFLFIWLALLFSGTAGCSPFGVVVTIANNTGGEITRLEVRFTGGSKSVPKLRAGESFKTRINPDGESSLVILFNDASGKKHSAEADVYFGHGYRGRIDVKIRPDGTLSWKDDIKV